MPNRKKRSKSGSKGKDVRDSRELVTTVALAVAKDKNSSRVIFCATRLLPFLQKLHRRRKRVKYSRPQLRRLISEELVKVMKKEKVDMGPKYRKMVVSAAMKFLDELHKKTS